MRTATLATCLALLTLLPASANAQSNLLRETNEAIIDPLSRSPIDLDTVIAAAIDANPTLEAARQRLIAAAQAATHVDALPDPRLRTGFYAVPFPSLDALGGSCVFSSPRTYPTPARLTAAWRLRREKRNAESIWSRRPASVSQQPHVVRTTRCISPSVDARFTTSI